MSTSQLPNEAATTQENANELALLESCDAGEWTSNPNEAQDIGRHLAAVSEALLKKSVSTSACPAWIYKPCKPKPRCKACRIKR